MRFIFLSYNAFYFAMRFIFLSYNAFYFAMRFIFLSYDALYLNSFKALFNSKLFIPTPSNYFQIAFIHFFQILKTLSKL